MPEELDPLNVALGARIRALRLARKMSLDDLGEAIGVRFQQIGKYEAGADRVAWPRLVALCRALDVTLDELAGDLVGKRRRGDAPNPDVSLADPLAHEMLLVFSRVKSRKVRQSLIDVVRASAK